MRRQYKWSPDNVVRATPARLIQRIAMAEANDYAHKVFRDNQLNELWKKRFVSQSRFSKFYNFIVSSVMEQIKPELQAELETNGTLRGKPIDVLIQVAQQDAITASHKRVDRIILAKQRRP